MPACKFDCYVFNYIYRIIDWKVMGNGLKGIEVVLSLEGAIFLIHALSTELPPLAIKARLTLNLHL